MVPWTRGDPHLLCLCVQDLWRLPHGADGCERRAGLRGLFTQGHQFAVDRALHPRAHAGARNHFQADPVLQARWPAPVRCLWAAARAPGVTGVGGGFLADIAHLSAPSYGYLVYVAPSEGAFTTSTDSKTI